MPCSRSVMMRVMPSSRYFHLQRALVVSVCMPACGSSHGWLGTRRASTHVALMSSRFGTGGIAAGLDTIVKEIVGRRRGSTPSSRHCSFERRRGGGTRFDASYGLAWAGVADDATQQSGSDSFRVGIDRQRKRRGGDASKTGETSRRGCSRLRGALQSEETRGEAAGKRKGQR